MKKYCICRNNKEWGFKDFTDFACSSESEAIALVAALNVANTKKHIIYYYVLENGNNRNHLKK